MRFHEMLVQLVKKHSPIVGQDTDEIMIEIDKDYKSIILSPEYHDKNPNEWTWKHTVKKHLESPYVRLGMVFLYWYLFRAIGEWLAGVDNDPRDSKEDEI